jgi:hypothetical protein
LSKQSEAVREANFKRWSNPENRLRMSQRNKKEKNPFFGKTHNNESLEKIREKRRKSGADKEASKRMKTRNPMHNPDVVSKVIETSLSNGAYKQSSSRMKTLWNDPEFASRVRKNFVSSITKLPTKPEVYLINLFKETNIPFTYNGNRGNVIIERRIPDFVYKNKIIEFDGTIHYCDDQHIADTEKRNQIYMKYGYSILILTYEDLKNKLELLTKVNTFVNQV